MGVTIKEGWDNFKIAVAGASSDELAALRAVFYAGAQHAFVSLLVLSESSDAEVELGVDRIAEEFKEFGKELS